MKVVGVVVIRKGFGVELATGEESAMFLWAGHIRGNRICDIFAKEHAGLDLMPGLQGESLRRVVELANFESQGNGSDLLG